MERADAFRAGPAPKTAMSLALNNCNSTNHTATTITLETDAYQQANDLNCYFVLADGEYRLSIPDDFTAVFR